MSPDRSFMENSQQLEGAMQAISATDARHTLATLLRTAQGQPVAIQQNQRNVAVVLSASEYQRLRGQHRAPAGGIDGRLMAMLDGCEA
jgi:prevent-host-death family protein